MRKAMEKMKKMEIMFKKKERERNTEYEEEKNETSLHNFIM